MDDRSRHGTSKRSKFLSAIPFGHSQSKAKEDDPKQVRAGANGTLESSAASKPSPSVRTRDVAESPGRNESKDLWFKAELKLLERNAPIHDALQRLKTEGNTDLSAKHLNAMLEKQHKDVTVTYDSHKYGIQRYLINAGYTLSAFRGALTSLSRFDSTGASAVIAPTMTSLLDVALAKVGLNQAIYRDIEDVFNKIEPSHYKEIHVLKHRTPQAQKLFDEAEAALVDLYTTILEYLVCTARYLEAGFLAGLLRVPIALNDIQELKRKIDVKYKTSETKFEYLKWDKDFRKGKWEILNWITDVDMLEVHRNLMRVSEIDDMLGTPGAWLPASAEYQSWDSGDGLKVFWLCGTAGTGKTTLSSIVISQLATPARLEGKALAYVYCSRTGKGVGACETVVSSLIRQLSEVKGSAELIRPTAAFHADLFEERRNGANPSKKEQQDWLEEIFRLSVPTYIVIDALDECDNPRTVLKMLKAASKHHQGKLRIFLTSRIGVDVKHETCFPDVTKQVLVKEMTKMDMRNYIYHKVFNSEERLLNGQDTQREEKLCQALLDQANGMFKWTQLRLRLIFRSKSGKAIRYADSRDVDELIERIQFRSIKEDEQLDDIWNQILEDNTEGGGNARRNALRAFKLVFAAVLPLTYHQIKQALQIEDPAAQNYQYRKPYDLKEDYVPLITQNFLVEHSGFVEFAHMSAVDFVRKTQEQTGESILTPLECQADMMHICLYSLRWVPGCLSRDPGDVATYAFSIAAGKGQLCIPFLQYSYLNWAVHCAAVLKLLDGDQRRQMVSFVSDNILTHEEWRDSLMIWFTAITSDVAMRNSLKLDRGPFDLTKLSQPWVADSPGLFIASAFDLPDLAECLIRNATSPAEAFGHFNHIDHCVISAAFSGASSELQRVLEGVTWTSQLDSSRTASQKLPNVLQTLLDFGADPNLKDSCNGETPAMRIVDTWNRYSRGKQTELCEVLQILLAYGMDIAAHNPYGQALLHYAVRRKLALIVQWILDNGPGLGFYEESPDTLTPVELAVDTNNHDVFLALLDHGADYQRAFPDSSSLWDIALKFYYTPEFAAAVQSRTQVKGLSNWPGTKPLVYAIDGQKVGWLKYLLSLLVEQDLSPAEQKAIAFAAVARSCWNPGSEAHMYVLCCLHRGRISLDPCDENGVTPLMVAASRLDADGLRCLIEFGCDVNSADNSGRTAFHYIVPHPTWCEDWYVPESMVEGLFLELREILSGAGACLGKQDVAGNTCENLLRLAGLNMGHRTDVPPEQAGEAQPDALDFQERLFEKYSRNQNLKTWQQPLQTYLYREQFDSIDWKAMFERIKTKVEDGRDIDVYGNVFD